MKSKIIIFGAGYVGASLGLLLSKDHEVVMVDINQEKVNEINDGEFGLSDTDLNDFVRSNDLNFSATTNFREHIYQTEFVILAVPTNFIEKSNTFDTGIINNIMTQLSDCNFSGIVTIKSTVPIGFTKKIKECYPGLKIAFSPEFLREGCALHDNLYPSRIVVGDSGIIGNEIASLLKSIANNDPKIILVNSDEAEAIKLFSNTFLACRVSFFNELDTFCHSNNLCTNDVIEGVCSDSRIGNTYNNPSFGYGGYCLPKDTKQLNSDYGEIPQALISSIIKSNQIRKEFIASKIIELNPEVVGVYRLIMKAGSDNFRDSAIFSIVHLIANSGIKVQIFEPLIKESEFDFKICNDLEDFKISSELILTNRLSKKLEDVKNKVFTRDIFGIN